MYIWGQPVPRQPADGRWEARYTIGFDPATGKQRQKSIYGKTQREVREKLTEIGTPNARVHDLRHTYAVLSLQNGDDIKTVQSNLGHATAAFTLDVYGHVSEHMKEDSANRMQHYIENL